MSDDVFQLGNGVPANFSDGTLKVLVNGTTYSSRFAAGSLSIGQIVNDLAKAKGIRTFSVYVDGRKLLVSEANKAASSFKEVDIVAKDARGISN